MTAISVRDVSIAYDGKLAVSGVSFELESGAWLAVVGENGSGKSTLIKGLTGICRLESGEIVFTDRGGAPGIGYLPQQIRPRGDFPASVSEVVLSGRVAQLGFLPFYTARDRKAAGTYMEKLGISALADRPFSGLSGGEQRRALLARAFCAARDLLILDEPTAGLDPLIAAEFYQILREFRDETGATIVMVSHDVDVAVSCASKILHMERSVRFFGSPAEYTHSETGTGFMGCYHG